MLRPAAARAASSLVRYGGRRSPRALSSMARAEEKDPVELDAITTLPNGIRVATEALPGHFSGIGVYVDAGSRYETESLSGVSHILDRLAFKSTTKRSSDQMLESMEMLGGNIQCASSRESLMYQSATFNSGVGDTIALLAETIRNPRITPEEIEQQLETADYEITEIWAKPELILPELVHVAAYRDNTLGNPLLCPKERLPVINRNVVDAYRKTFFLPERIVVAFAGVEHEKAVKMTEKWFGDMERGRGVGLPSPELPNAHGSEPVSSLPISSSYTNNQPPHQKNMLSKIPFFKSLSTSASNAASIISNTLSFEQPNLTLPSHYTGGYLALPSEPSQNPAVPPLTHIHLAFESPSITSADIYAVAVLQTLLGGGGSFSAGGPGKGMYSRLYTNVLNQHAWVESCVAFNHGYSDSGVFGIAASCAPGHVTNMLDVMCRELGALGQETGRLRLSDREVQRAKNQLRSNLLMNLESRMVELEDLGRQVQTHGRKIGVKEMCAKIDGVTVAELRRVARLVFGGEVKNVGAGTGIPTVVMQEGEGGNGFKGGWEEIQERIQKWGLGVK